MSGFFNQYKSTREFSSDTDTNPEYDPICGFQMFQNRGSTYNDGGSSDDGNIFKDYVFENDDIVVKTVETGDNIIGLNHGRTATTAKSGGGSFENPPTHNVITLSSPVGKSYLEGKRSLWTSQDDEFKNTTGISSVINTDSDNAYSKVGVGDTRARSSLMYPRDFAGLWDNHSAYVKITTRKNSPTLYEEASGNSLGSGSVASGQSCYRAGYAEEVLSDLVTKPWRDDYGTWAESELIDDAPQFKDYGTVDYFPLGEGRGHEATYISKTGKKIRATFELGEYDYGENYEDSPIFNVSQTVVKTTSDDTLQFSVSFDEHTSIRLFRIEVYDESKEEWEEVANADDGVNPDTLVAENACDEGYLLCFVKRRQGNKWGFTERKSPYEATYSKKHFKKHLNVGAMNLDSGSCGGAVSGDLDLDIVTEYDVETGLKLDPVVNQWSAVIGGKKWTPEDPFDYYDMRIYGGSTVVDTATTWKKESDYEWTGRYFVALDEANSGGQIVSEKETKMSLSEVEGDVLSPWIELTYPASGQSVFYGGHRLSPD